jgi:hypothetical protein
MNTCLAVAYASSDSKRAIYHVQSSETSRVLGESPKDLKKHFGIALRSLCRIATAHQSGNTASYPLSSFGTHLGVGQRAHNPSVGLRRTLDNLALYLFVGSFET